MVIGVLLPAVAGYLGSRDHGIGSVVTAAMKSAVVHATVQYPEDAALLIGVEWRDGRWGYPLRGYGGRRQYRV